MKALRGFLPVSREEMSSRGWDALDFLFISGDAYVDHPSFGPAIITRLLEKAGYRVGVIAQPNWRDTKDFKVMGRPRLAVMISAGNMDSMLNKLTAAKKVRSKDSYSPGGQAGLRPDRATIVYSNRIRECWADIPVVVGGIEASLRRFSHYDYWSESVRRSILVDSRADLLVYGMGETQVLEIAEKLAAGVPIETITNVRGTCYLTGDSDNLPDNFMDVPSHERVSADKAEYAAAFKVQYLEQDPIRGHAVVQKYGDRYLVQNPPALPLGTREMDRIYSLPYERTWHPSYDNVGGVPAIEEVQFSITSHRGCFGACSFCAIGSHQGRIIQQRSHKSIIQEAQLLTRLPGFKGYIHDVGGPTANFRHVACAKQMKEGTCRERQCLFPKPCPQLDTDHSDYLRLLREVRALPGIKKVFIRSGIRYDYLMAGKYQEFLSELCEHHVSGQLKVAPEHVARPVIEAMQKSGKDSFLKFLAAFRRENERLGKEQYLVPYLMCSHPGSSLTDAIELAAFLRDIGYHPEQVQEFIPTPGSLSTVMYYTGIHPLTGKSIFVPKTMEQRQTQRALLQYRHPKNRRMVAQALRQAGRGDLIGFAPGCLLRPERPERRESGNSTAVARPKKPRRS
ncbi:MAG TPA: YgiQ family radical SAM protein [Negativicutes bacterium]|nr:YgiQ family radical SAM protein [Negativicutes bacterium]